MSEKKNNNFKKRSRNSDRKYSGSRKADYSTCNDPAWYNHSPILTKDSASIPFVNYTGLAFEPSGKVPYINAGGYILPGIMRLNFVPAYGYGSRSSDALNVSSNKNYAENRRWNSGARNYVAPDYMLHFMALDNAFMLWAYAVRAYGILNLYDTKNRYTPKSLIQSMGLDFNDLLKNQADFRSYINQFAAKLNSCPVPKEMDIIKRHTFMVANVYQDHSNSKSQFYYFQPDFIYKMDKTKRNTGGCLVPFKMPGDSALPWGVDDFKNAFDTIIDDLLNDEDFSIMCGDTLKAFPNVWSIGSVEENYTTQFVYDEQILEQIHNAKFVGPVFNPTSEETEDDTITPDIYQKSGVIHHHPVVRDFTVESGIERDLGTILDSRKDEQPDPIDVMYMSRLTATVGKTQLNHTVEPELYYYPVTSFGSEIMTTCRIYYLNADNNLLNYDTFFTGILENTGDLTMAAKITSFDWHPRFVIWRETTDFNTGANMMQSSAILWESKNIAVLSDENVHNLHETAILSLLNLPIKEAKTQ